VVLLALPSPNFSFDRCPASEVGPKLQTPSEVAVGLPLLLNLCKMFVRAELNALSERASMLTTMQVSAPTEKKKKTTHTQSKPFFLNPTTPALIG
jgi:hypothetical protein